MESFKRISKGFNYVTGTDTACADLDTLDATLTNCFYLLQVWMPSAASLVVSMTDIVTEAHTFAADFTNFRHKLTS